MKLQTILLRLYPREWRARYEEEYTVLLEQTRPSLLDIADVALGALDAHLRPQVAATGVATERRLFMNRATFIQWSGMAAMAGSVLVLLGVIGSQLANTYPHNFGVEDVVTSTLVLVGAVLLLVGTIGFGFAYARRTGGLGQVGLFITLLGLISLTFGSVGGVMEKLGKELPNWWYMIMLGLFGMFLGMALFGGAALRQRVLALYQISPSFVSGVVGVVVLLLSLGLTGANEGAVGTILSLGFFASIVLSLVGFFVVGASVWSGRETSARQIGPASAG